MSNTIGNGFLNQALYHSTFPEHQNRSYSRTTGNSLYRGTSPSFISTKSARHIRKLLVSTKFCEKNFSTAKTKLSQGRRQKFSTIPRAVLATDPASEVCSFLCCNDSHCNSFLNVSFSNHLLHIHANFPDGPYRVHG